MVGRESMVTNPVSLLLTLVMPLKMGIGGGGGDGGAQAEADRLRAEESQRDYRIAQDKAKINALFGVTDYDYETMPEVLSYDGGLKSATGRAAELETLQGLLSEAEADPDYAGSYGSRPGASTGYSDAGYETFSPRTASWQDQIASLQDDPAVAMLSGHDPSALTTQAGESEAARGATLEGVKGDIMSKYLDELNTQFGRKESDVHAMLAGRGLTRSTVGQSIFDRLGEISDVKKVGFEESASSAIDKMRTADEATRSNLINLISAGEDYGNVRTTALSELESNISGAKSQAMAQDLSNLFAGMNELYGQSQYVDAYNQGQRTGSSSLVTPGSTASVSGTNINY